MSKRQMDIQFWREIWPGDTNCWITRVTWVKLKPREKTRLPRKTMEWEEQKRPGWCLTKLSQWRVRLQCRRPRFDSWVRKIHWRKDKLPTPVFFPCGSAGKESACNAEEPGSIPGSRRSAGEGIGYPLRYSWASLVAQTVKTPPAVQETIWSLGWEDPLEKGKATHSNILAWRIPWTV